LPSDTVKLGDAVNYVAGASDTVKLGDALSYSNGVADTLKLGDAVNYTAGVGDIISLRDIVAYTRAVADTLKLGDSVNYVAGVRDTIKLGDTVAYSMTPSEGFTLGDQVAYTLGAISDTLKLGDAVSYSMGAGSPILEIVDVSPDPVNAYVGIPFTISVTVRETGGYPCTGLITLKDDKGNTVAQDEEQFNAFQQKTIILRVDTLLHVGTYIWTVEVYNETTQTTDDTRNITINVTTPQQIPYFTIEYIIPSTVNTSPGSKFNVSFIIAIYGAVSGTCILYIYDHLGNKVSEQWIIFKLQQEQTVIVSLTAPDTPGSYLWRAVAYSFNAQQVTDEKKFTVNVSSGGGGGGGGAVTTIIQKAKSYAGLILLAVIGLGIALSRKKRTV